jgi:hypothetical protein
MIRTTLSAIAVLAAFTGFATAQQVTVPDAVALNKEGTIEISGAGFAPNESVYVLFSTSDGVTSDIGYALDPEPVADADGNWVTTWSYGRFVAKGLVAAGAFDLMVTDEDFNELASVKVDFAE